MLMMRSVKQVRARKEYECHLCGKKILKKKWHMVEKYRDDNGYTTVRRHIHCDAMLDAFNAHFNPGKNYTDEKVTDTLCKKLCCRICDAEEREKCDKTDVYGCAIAQKWILPESIIGTVAESVRDNEEWDNYFD